MSDNPQKFIVKETVLAEVTYYKTVTAENENLAKDLIQQGYEDVCLGWTVGDIRDSLSWEVVNFIPKLHSKDIYVIIENVEVGDDVVVETLHSNKVYTYPPEKEVLELMINCKVHPDVFFDKHDVEPYGYICLTR